MCANGLQIDRHRGGCGRARMHGRAGLQLQIDRHRGGGGRAHMHGRAGLQWQIDRHRGGGGRAHMHGRARFQRQIDRHRGPGATARLWLIPERCASPGILGSKKPYCLASPAVYRVLIFAHHEDDVLLARADAQVAQVRDGVAQHDASQPRADGANLLVAAGGPGGIRQTDFYEVGQTAQTSSSPLADLEASGRQTSMRLKDA
jgi:hypothetical protein